MTDGITRMEAGVPLAKKRKALVLAVLAAIVACAALSTIRPGGSAAEKVLDDGTVISLSGIQFDEAVYYEGSLLERTLGRLAPTNGLKFAGFTLKRPEECRWGLPKGGFLIVRMQIFPKASSKAKSNGSGLTNRFTASWLPGPGTINHAFRSYSLTVAGDNGVVYGMGDFGTFHDYSNRLAVIVGMRAFPRDSKYFHFRLQSSDGNTRSELATFVLKNPRPIKPAASIALNAPKFKLSPDLDLEIGEATQEIVKVNTNISIIQSIIPFRVLQHGQIATNWGIAEGKAEDTVGNPVIQIGNLWQITNGWILSRVNGTIDPSHPWSIHLDVAPWRNFPATNLHSVYVNLPLSGTFKTNVDGFPFEVSSSSGYLEIRMATNQPGLRMKVLHVIDRTGRDLTRGSSWIYHDRGQYFYRTSFYRPSGAAQIKIVTAIVPTFGVDFVVQPRVAESKGSGRGGSIIDPTPIYWDFDADDPPLSVPISELNSGGDPQDLFNPRHPELVHPDQIWW